MMELYEIIDEIKETLEFKNREYGDTPLKTQKILEVLYPSGIPTSAYQDVLLLVRILDKLCRIANGCGSIGKHDAYLDIAGYGVLGVMNTKRISDTINGIDG